MPVVTHEVLRDVARRVLSKHGVRDDIAGDVVDGLVWTSLRGIDSHGIRLLPHYVAGVVGGRINPNPTLTFSQTAPSIGVVDADHTFGHAAGVFAMRHAVDVASSSGVGAVAVRNSSHCGALSFFGHLAAESGMIGIAFTHATARIKTPGSHKAFFGNNPICFVAPMLNEEPFCFDAAMSSITFNAVRAAADLGRSLDPGLVADANGEPTTDPRLATMLLPIGNYKGFGLCMLVDILCAILTGMPSGNNVSAMFESPMDQRRLLGHFFCALKIECFRDIAGFSSDLADLAARVRDLPSSGCDGLETAVPGDPEKRIYRERLNNGIPVEDHDWQTLTRLA
jgi:ureidoglycolate dehydrogenase (NAD+)